MEKEKIITIFVERQAQKGKEKRLVALVKKLEQVFTTYSGYIHSSFHGSNQGKLASGSLS